jgi:quinol-cytochrome oxidoreductase complex cytochrome b subunit
MMMIQQLQNWLDERTDWKTIWETIFLRRVPKVNWFYTLGSATLFLALNQGITGILLTLYYVPSPDSAYKSVSYIVNELPGGWFIQGLHHWGASAMVVVTVLHMLRVIIFGSYKYPRELTWFSGVFLLMVVVGFGFTGYLLPWDQKAYWATTVGTRIAGTPPLIGDFILRVARGGPELSQLTLVRFFGVHVWFLPAALIALVGFHIFMVIKLGISTVPDKNEKADNVEVGS